MRAHIYQSESMSRLETLKNAAVRPRSGLTLGRIVADGAEHGKGNAFLLWETHSRGS